MAADSASKIHTARPISADTPRPDDPPQTPRDMSTNSLIDTEKLTNCQINKENLAEKPKNTAKNSEIFSENKVSEPVKIQGIERLRTALEFNAHRRASRARASGQLGTVHNDKCNTCLASKGSTEPWIDHNISVNHITALINKKGFGQAVADLEKITEKFVQIQCDICHTWNKNKVTFNSHKLDEDHKKRKTIINNLLNVAYETTDIAKHIKIAKPPTMLAGAISKSLKYKK